MNADMPSITGSTYSTSVLSHVAADQFVPADSTFLDNGQLKRVPRLVPEPAQALRGLHLGGPFAGAAEAAAKFDPDDYLNKEPTVSTRIVKVFIADPNENLPLDKRVLYAGDEKFTDLTDQELFFEVPITEILGKHNELRKATLDKKTTEKSGRDVFLEPARVRDLRMVVVNVATF